MPSAWALVVAGGSGQRMGADRPKQMLMLGEAPVLIHTLRKFFDHSVDLRVCLVLHASLLPEWPGFAADYLTADQQERLLTCAGGDSRTASVGAGLEAIAHAGEGEDAVVMIHDAVRPFLTKSMINAALLGASRDGSAVAAVQVKSSLRRKLAGGGSTAVDRSEFYHVQTPQAFPLGLIRSAYRHLPQGSFTDDASLAEAAGIPIHLFEGSYDNIKITTPEDLPIARDILRREENQA